MPVRSAVCVKMSHHKKVPFLSLCCRTTIKYSHAVICF